MLATAHSSQYTVIVQRAVDDQEYTISNVRGFELNANTRFHIAGVWFAIPRLAPLPHSKLRTNFDLVRRSSAAYAFASAGERRRHAFASRDKRVGRERNVVCV